MNIEDYREYCLSLGEDIEEKLPFQRFKLARLLQRARYRALGLRARRERPSGALRRKILGD